MQLAFGPLLCTLSHCPDYSTGPGLARCNVYRPHATEHGERFPVLMVSCGKLRTAARVRRHQAELVDLSLCLVDDGTLYVIFALIPFRRFRLLNRTFPDGKDIHYSDFHAKSWSEIPAEHKSKVSKGEPAASGDCSTIATERSSLLPVLCLGGPRPGLVDQTRLCGRARRRAWPGTESCES